MVDHRPSDREQRIRLRRSATLGLVAVLGLSLASCGPGVVLIAADSFDTNLRSGWGSTESGGIYTLAGERSDFDVSDGVGTIVLRQPATPRAAYLDELSVSDYSATIRISTDRNPSGGRQFVYLSMRRTDDSEYLAKLSFAPGGDVFLEASRLTRGTTESETSLGPEVKLARVLHEPGTWFKLEVDIRGAAPSSIRVRAWPERAQEPGWLISVTDGHEALQGPGTFGFRATLGSQVDELPVTVSVDDLRIGR